MFNLLETASKHLVIYGSYEVEEHYMLPPVDIEFVGYFFLSAGSNTLKGVLCERIPGREGFLFLPSEIHGDYSPEQIKLLKYYAINTREQQMVLYRLSKNVDSGEWTGTYFSLASSVSKEGRGPVKCRICEVEESVAIDVLAPVINDDDGFSRIKALVESRSSSDDTASA